MHYTGVRHDTAKNNVDFFATYNTRSAGAHYFIDANGTCARSVPIERVAWSVGDKNGRGKYHGILANSNTISIELCDLIDHKMTDKQYAKVKKLVKSLAKKCPNVKYVCRHYDITTKICPAYYVTHTKDWNNVQQELLSIIKKVRKEL